MEPGTGLTILGGAIGSAKLIEKMLGPTADFLGNELQSWTEKRITNVKNIFSNAEKKLGNEIEKKGTVPPKVLKEILDDGSFVNDELSIEYFGGILACSRTKNGLDDRATSFLNLLSQLSFYQIKSHYIIYHSIRKILKGEELLFTKLPHREKMRIFIPMEDFINSIGNINKEEKIIIISHIFFGLKRIGLIEDFTYSSSSLKYDDKGNKMPGIRIVPSEYGAQLFLWTYGIRNKSTKMILSNDLELKRLETISLPDKIISYPKVEKKKE